mmetsp:Transcript_32374/g.71109  ORF Transcript_32374/g.71109 Transcript_32374/m.71109 type:complete len:310 (+) Transcript_32374:927-1856(+)
MPMRRTAALLIPDGAVSMKSHISPMIQKAATSVSPITAANSVRTSHSPQEMIYPNDRGSAIFSATLTRDQFFSERTRNRPLAYGSSHPIKMISAAMTTPYAAEKMTEIHATPMRPVLHLITARPTATTMAILKIELMATILLAFPLHSRSPSALDTTPSMMFASTATGTYALAIAAISALNPRDKMTFSTTRNKMMYRGTSTMSQRNSDSWTYCPARKQFPNPSAWAIRISLASSTASEKTHVRERNTSTIAYAVNTLYPRYLEMNAAIIASEIPSMIASTVNGTASFRIALLSLSKAVVRETSSRQPK